MLRYLQRLRAPLDNQQPLFIAEFGRDQGAGLTRNGMFFVIESAGKRAGLTGVRCSPHTCRHTFAVNFLRGGGSVLELKELLGHEDLKTLQRYVTLAQSDLRIAHRAASPVDRLRLR